MVFSDNGATPLKYPAISYVSIRVVVLQLYTRSMPPYLFFHLGLSFITLHEMDAVRCREWRIFPGLSLLNDTTGRLLFLLLHIPIFYWIYLQISGSAEPGTFRLGFDIFCILHLGLHILFLRHKNNEFKDGLSWLFITGAAGSGLADLLVSCL